MTISGPLSVVAVPLSLDAEGCESYVLICEGMDVGKAGTCVGGKAEVVSNKGKGCSMVTPLWVGDHFELHGVVGTPLQFLQLGVRS